VKPSYILGIAAVMVVVFFGWGLIDTMRVMRQLSQFACDNDTQAVYTEECTRLGLR
jgi:FtsH-binding integral membrane protein